MERLVRILNELQKSKRHFESALPDNRKTTGCEKEKSAFLDVKEILVQKEIQKDLRFNEQFTRAVELLFFFISHRNPDVRLVAEQSLTCVFRVSLFSDLLVQLHMVIESNSSRVVVSLLMELKRNGGARSLVAAFNLLAEVIDFVKPNKTGVIGAHIVGALCTIARRPEDSVQNCLEKSLPRIFSVFGRQFTTHRSEDSSNLYEIALENLELSGSSSRAAAMIIYQLSLYFPEILKKTFKQFRGHLLQPQDEKKNILVGTFNALRLLWPSILSRKGNFNPTHFQEIIRGALLCLFSHHNDVVVASLEFLEALFSNFLVFVDSLVFSPIGEVQLTVDQSDDIQSVSCLPEVSDRLSPLNLSLGDPPDGPQSLLISEGSVSSSDLYHSGDNVEEASCERTFSSADDEEILDPLRHGSVNLSEEEVSNSVVSTTSENLTQHFECLSFSNQLPTDICSDSFAVYAAVLLARRFLLSDHCLRQIPDSDVRVSHKILAMNCLAHLANCLPNFFNTPLRLPAKLGTPLLKDIQLFVNHEDDLLKAAAVTAIVNATQAAFYVSESNISDSTTPLKKCVFDVMHFRKAQCSRALLSALKSAGEVVCKLGLTDALCKFACECSKDNYFLLRVAVAEYLASIKWGKLESCTFSLLDYAFETYLRLLADSDQRVAEAAARELPFLVSNANYCELRNSGETDWPQLFLCSAFDREPLTAAMGQEYKFFEQANCISSINLSIVLNKLLAHLEVKADELEQAGIAAGLASLAEAFPPALYSSSWGVNAHGDTSRIGLLLSLLSQCSTAPSNMRTLSKLFEVISYLFAGICGTTITKVLTTDDSVPLVFPIKFLDIHFMEQLILSSLRVLNLYYTIIVEHEQNLTMAKSAILSPNMSPVRKVLLSNSVVEQRTQTITNLVGTGIKPSKMTSFLHSSALINVADSLRGMYSNYMEGLSQDVKGKFVQLLISSLNHLSCILEMAYFSHISSLLKEILFYCRITVDFAPVETVRLVIQLLKALFGRNAANLNIKELKKIVPPTRKSAQGQDFFEAMLLQDANRYTEFVVNLGRKDSYYNQLMMCSGWIRREVFHKSRLTPGNAVAETIGLFESFVSKTIRMFYVSNSYLFQALTLHLLCELISGGINFSMLDPKMQLSNFLFAFVNEFGSRNWFNSETVDTEEVILIRSVFHFFTLISRIEFDGQPCLEPRRMTAFCEVMINAAIAKPQLARCALNSLQVVLLEFIAVRKRFEHSVEKILCAAEPLAKNCPMEYIENWGLFLHSASIYGDDQSRSKISLLFFDIFQRLRCAWNFDTAFSGMIALRLCSPATFRPIDTFLKNLIEILLSDDLSQFERLLYASPYLFMLLCVMDDDYVLPGIEQATDMSSAKVAELLMKLLFGCVNDLRKLSLPKRLSYGVEYCRRLTWFLQALSYAVRSGGLKSVTGVLAEFIPESMDAVNEVSMWHSKLFVPFLTFYSSLDLSNSELLHQTYNKDFELLCKLIQLRGHRVKTVEELTQLLHHSSQEELPILISTLTSNHLLNNLTPDESFKFCDNCFDLLRDCSSLSCAFDVLNLMETGKIQKLDNLKSFPQLKGRSYALDRCLSSTFHNAGFTAEPAFEKAVESHIESRDLLGSFDEILKQGIQEYSIDLFPSLSKLEPTSFDRDSLCELILSLMKKPGKVIAAPCVAGNLSLFDASCSERVLKCAYVCGRFDIVSACMEEMGLINMAAFNCGDMYSEYSVVSVQKAEIICQICVDLAYDLALNSPLQFYAQSKFAEKVGKIFLKPASEWARDPKRFDYWLNKYIELISVGDAESYFLDSMLLGAISFSISQPSFITAIENADLRDMIEKQLLFGESFARVLKSLTNGKAQKIRSEADRERLNWDIITHDRSGKKGIDLSFFSESVQTAFELVMVIQDTFRKKLISGYLMKPLEKLAKAITRLPLFNDVASIPRMALLCKWRVELEIRNNAVVVSTVNVHHLCNVDILRDFIWRLCWAGWNRNTNFSNFSMSLFGVLSSTPTGSELHSASLNVTEQLMASAAAIEGLTNILLQTTFYPERGNPVISRFLVRPREMSTNFLSTPLAAHLPLFHLFGQRLCMLKARLGGFETDCTFQKNCELLEENLHRYSPGHLSVHAMWNMSGVLELERNLFSGNAEPNPTSPKRQVISTSDSSYLIQSGHDSTNESCLRMLFDIYSHWFRTGIDAVPLPLLSEIIKSMLLLSDLFVDLDQFEFVLNHMKSLFAARSHIENVDLGNIICSILKCIAVLGLEGVSLVKTDAQKLLVNCIECGLISNCAEVRIRTLQGLLYVLQSISHEELRSILSLVQSFLLNELSVRSPGMDPVNMEIEFESRGYETLLWTVGFFLCENLLYSSEDFRATLLDFLYKTFMSSFTPVWLMDLLTSGAERLIVSSRTYISTFSRVAVQMIRSYFTMPSKFIFALRIAMVCLYHGMHEAKVHRIGLEPYDSELYLMEQFPVIFRILAEGSEDDASLLMKVLPYLLIDSLNQSEIINNVLKELIHRYPRQSHPRPKAIFLIVHHWFGVLRSRETEAVVIEWTLNGLDSFKYITNPSLYRFYVNAFICSSSTNPYVASLFYLIVNRNNEASWLDDLWFPFIIRSLLLRLNEDTICKLKKKMEVYIANGIEHRDPSRVRDFPVI